jgi:WD40 repeat protein
MASASKDRSIKVYKLVYFEKEFKAGALEKLQLALNINEAHSTEITALGSSPSLIFSMSSTGELKMWDLYDG